MSIVPSYPKKAFEGNLTQTFLIPFKKVTNLQAKEKTDFSFISL